MESVAQKEFISGYIVERTAKRMKLAFSRILAEYPTIDITVDQWVLLQLLFKNGPMSQAQLADESNKDAPTITRIIDLLVDKDYVQRMNSLKDRRKFNISPTDKGHRMIRTILPIVNTYRQAVYDGFSSEELHQLEKAMSRIDNNIKSLLNTKS